MIPRLFVGLTKNFSAHHPYLIYFVDHDDRAPIHPSSARTRCVRRIAHLFYLGVEVVTASATLREGVPATVRPLDSRFLVLLHKLRDTVSISLQDHVIGPTDLDT